MNWKLNLPHYTFRTQQESGKPYIFDSIRKKFVSLTPEEWVRQHFMTFLIREKRYSSSLLAVEKQIIVNGIQRRFDLLCYNRNGGPYMVAEFKAPDVKITQDTFDQVVRYNMVLKAEYVVVSNGINHFVCQMDYERNTYSFLKEIPEYPDKCRNTGLGFS